MKTENKVFLHFKSLWTTRKYTFYGSTIKFWRMNTMVALNVFKDRLWNIIESENLKIIII